MRKNLCNGRYISTPPSTNQFVVYLNQFILLLMIAVPGLSVCQCPTSYSGEMLTAEDYGPLCGFKSIVARINMSSTEDVFGRMEVIFSNNVKILDYEIRATYVDDVVIAANGYELSFDIGDICEPVEVKDND